LNSAVIVAVEPVHSPTVCVHIKVCEVLNVFDVKVVDGSLVSAKTPIPEWVHSPLLTAASTLTDKSISPHVVSSVTVDELVTAAAISAEIVAVFVQPFEAVVPVTTYDPAAVISLTASVDESSVQTYVSAPDAVTD
jgi:hypothetical protein